MSLCKWSIEWRLFFNSWKAQKRHHNLKRKKFWQIWAICIHGTRGTHNEAPPTFNSQLCATGTNGHERFTEWKLKNVQKYFQESLFWTSIAQQQFEVSVAGYVHARESGATMGQENTEPRAFEMARHWVADFWVAHHLGRAPIRLVRVQLGRAQMGNAVKDQ